MNDTMSDELIPFDLDRALAGDKVITRDGREATQITFFDIKNETYCLFAVIAGNFINAHTKEGKFYEDKRLKSKLDLFMAPKGE